MGKTITRLFDDLADTRGIVRELKAMGYSFDQISVVSGHVDDVAARASRVARSDSEREAGEDAGKGEVIGGLAGVAAGLLGGLGLLTVSGAGPAVAAGWLASTVGAAAAGAVSVGAATGLVSVLVREGADERDAMVYAEGVRRGGALVSVRADARDEKQVVAAMYRLGGVDAATREPVYRAAGWDGEGRT